MPGPTADIVICGAGIAGISSAYHLATRHKPGRILLVDERAPMSLTSDKSTECYRNWWPGPGSAMVGLMNRSIDLLEHWADESGNVFNLNRRGYLFATARSQQAETYRQMGEEISSLGAGPLRVHRGSADDPPYQPAGPEGYRDQPSGADLILDHEMIHREFPHLSQETIAVLQPRRAGWFSAQQLGSYLLHHALAAGVEFVPGSVAGVEVKKGRVKSVRLASAEGSRKIETRRFVLAPGPKLAQVAGMMDLELPVFSELHTKVSFSDSAQVIPRGAGLLIWSDPVELPWSEAERELLSGDSEASWLLDTFPPGVHGRPEGPPDSPIVLLLWTYDSDPVEPTYPPRFDDEVYPEVALRGFARMIPALARYFDRMPRPYVDGGYYTKTRENRPLIGPLAVDGAYVFGALSGFGLMASPAGGELLAAHVTGSDLPDYQSWFRLERYQDPAYQRQLEDWGSSGQL